MGCLGSKSSPKLAESKYSKPASTSAKPDDEKMEARRKNAEYISTLQTLAKVPLLRRLPKDQHPILAACCVHQVFKPGQAVFKQGDVGNEFFVICNGEASVFVGGDSAAKMVATVRAGDYFGEGALLQDEPRSATVKAKTELSTIKISREKFRELGLHEKLEFAKRKAVISSDAGAPSTNSNSPPIPPKTDEERTLIVGILQRNHNLQTIAAMDKVTLDNLANSAWRQEIADGEEVIKQGDDRAEYFYLVESGSFDVLVSEAVPEPPEMLATASGNELPPSEPISEPTSPTTRKSMAFGAPKKVGTVQAGGSFGELALMYSVPRAATIRATQKSKVWVIDRWNFKRMLMKASAEKVKEYEQLLDGVEVFTTLLQDEKRAVAEALSEMTFVEGDIVLTQGDVGDAFFILYAGEVKVIKDGIVVSTLTARMDIQVAHYFGERALIRNEPRAATVKVVSPVARALVLEKSSFELLLGCVKEFMALQDQGTGSKRANPLAAQAAFTEKVTLDDLELIGVLGIGAFGKVELQEDKRSKKTYAVKLMSKGYIAKMKMQNNVLNEKHILASCCSPFIIRLHNTANSDQWLYFFLEPALGGELYVIYHRRCLHGSLPHAKYYVSSVVLAFEHLHERHVIYRDLKPENLLLSSEGYLKLTDMGLAKFALGKTFTTCGTPEYFAPEVIRSSGQTRSVDWWTLGILIFELMTGGAPFKAENDMAMYAKVLKGIGHITFPTKAEGPTEALVKAMLKPEPSERLPMKNGGVKNLKEHVWFKGFDWEGVVSRKLVPPLQPAVKSTTDLRNFHHVKSQKPNWIDFVDDGTGWDQDF